jgi:hypothetical protein
VDVRHQLVHLLDPVRHEPAVDKLDESLRRGPGAVERTFGRERPRAAGSSGSRSTPT